MRNRDGLRLALLVSLVATVEGSAAQRETSSLLRDGLLLRAAEGRVYFATETQGWYFENQTDLSDGQVTRVKSSRMEILPSSTLDSLRIDLAERGDSNYRLWAKVTQYEAKNFLFLDRFLPLSTSRAEEAPEPQAVPSGGQSEASFDPLGIPIALDRRRVTRRTVERQSAESVRALKPNRLILDRVGYLSDKEGDTTFVLSGLGLQFPSRRFSLLPCRLLTRMQQEQLASLTPVHFKIAGLITEYQGQDYLMVQRATPVYNYGNFGR